MSIHIDLTDEETSDVESKQGLEDQEEPLLTAAERRAATLIPISAVSNKTDVCQFSLGHSMLLGHLEEQLRDALRIISKQQVEILELRSQLAEK